VHGAGEVRGGRDRDEVGKDPSSQGRWSIPCSPLGVDPHAKRTSWKQTENTILSNTHLQRSRRIVQVDLGSDPSLDA